MKTNYFIIGFLAGFTLCGILIILIIAIGKIRIQGEYKVKKIIQRNNNTRVILRDSYDMILNKDDTIFFKAGDILEIKYKVKNPIP